MTSKTSKCIYKSNVVQQGRLIERSKGKGTKLCVAVRMEQRQTCMHYQPAKHKSFLKIVLATPTMVTQARGNSYFCFVRVFSFVLRLLHDGQNSRELPDIACKLAVCFENMIAEIS